MAKYQRQNFKNGDTLLAEHLNLIEEAITNLEDNPSIKLDTTLTQEDVAAEAYSTGVRLTTLQNKIDNLNSTAFINNNITTLPNYWYDLFNRRLPQVRKALMDAGWNKSAFFWYHDSHWQQNSGRSPEILKYLQYKTPINKTNFGGDITDLEQEDLSKLDYLWNWRMLLNGVNNHHSVAGNHDDCNSTEGNGVWWSPSNVYAYLLGPEAQPHVNQGEGLYYYIDDNSEHTRYIYLDTATSKGTISNADINNQLSWLKQTLISTPSDWHIVAIAHIWKHYRNTTVDGVSYYYTDKDWSSDANKWYGQKALQEFGLYNAREGNYTNCKAKVEFCIGGHTHWDADYIYEYNQVKIPVILTTSDALSHRFPLEETDDTMDDYETTVWTGNLNRETANALGTVNEAAVDAIIADYNNGYVNIIRFGRGSSRKVYLDCRTNIHELIEDANVPSMPEGTYNNILLQVGYLDDTRVSLSNSGITQNATGWDTTGYIPCHEGDTISFANIEFYDKTANTQHSSIHYYDSNKIYLGSDVSTPLPNKYQAINSDSGDLLQFVLPIMNEGKYSYIRITASDLNDASVITINQPLYDVPDTPKPDDGPEDEDTTSDYDLVAPTGNFTNLLKTATTVDGVTLYNGGYGYKNDTRITSQDVEANAPGWDVTGYIPASPGAVIRLHNILFTRDPAELGTEYSRASIFMYDSDRNPIKNDKGENTCIFPKRNETPDEKLAVVTNESGDYIQLTLYAGWYPTLGYIRICADDITGASIITVNEEIDIVEQ